MVATLVVEFKLGVDVDKQVVPVVVMALEASRLQHNLVSMVFLDSEIEGDCRPTLATRKHASQTRLFLGRFAVHVRVLVRLGSQEN